MNIVKASTHDHVELTELTKKSKAFWGYTRKQLDEWREFLTISEEYVDKNTAYNLVVDSQIVGYYSYIIIDDKKVKLDMFFILPEYIGMKYGSYLLNDFISRAKETGFSVVTIDSEPNSEEFYKKFGFEIIDSVESSIKGRFIPIMERKL